jgi:hypothetical protein
MEDKEQTLIKDIIDDCRQQKYGYITYKLIIHQGQITGYEEIERRKVRRV